MLKGIGRKAVAVSLFAALAAPVSAAPIQLITNGDFETGSLAGWTVTNASDGDFVFDQPGTTTPISGHATTATAANGRGYAVTDQNGSGIHALSQAFSLGASSSVILSFDMFVNDWDSGPLCANGLSISSGAVQCGRVDIVSTAAGPFDTGAGVLANLYLGVDPDPDPNGFASYLFDITSIVGGGGSYVLRFAEADNQFYFNMGVDNVSIVANSVPAPATLLLAATGLLALGRSRFEGRK